MPTFTFPLRNGTYGGGLVNCLQKGAFHSMSPEASAGIAGGNIGTGKAGVRRTTHQKFDMSGSPDSIKAGAVFSSAFLETRASDTNSAVTGGAAQALLKDGIWDPSPDFEGYQLNNEIRVVPDNHYDMFIGIRDAGFLFHNGVNVPVGGVTNLFWGGGGNPKEIGQSILHPAEPAVHGNILKVLMGDLSRGTATGGQVVMDIYATTETDGSDDRPTGAVIATSDPINVTSFSTALIGSRLTFTFGGGGWPFAVGERRVGMLREVVENPITGGALAIVIDPPDQAVYDDGTVVRRVGGSGFNSKSYMVNEETPLTLDEDGLGSFLHNATTSEIVLMVAPNFLVNGVYYRWLNSIHELLNSWILQSLEIPYAEGDDFGLTMATSFLTAGLNLDRLWSDARLVCTWENPNPLVPLSDPCVLPGRGDTTILARDGVNPLGARPDLVIPAKDPVDALATRSTIIVPPREKC